MTGAFRRSELAALTVGDVEFDHDGPALRGLLVRLRRSKTDQEGRGQAVDIPYLGGPACPVAALQRWLDWLEPTVRGGGRVQLDPAAPLWRRIHRDRGGDLQRRIAEAGLSPRSVAAVVTARAAAAELPGRWSGHSLRRGFATAAYAGGTDEVEIMRHGRWRSAAVMRGYLEEGTRFRDTHAVHRLGLPDRR